MRAVAIAEVGGRRGSVLGPIVWILAILALLAALILLLAQIQRTVLLSSPEVRAAQARESAAEADYQRAQLERDTANTRTQARAEASWESWLVGAERIAEIALIAAVPIGLLGVLVAAGLLVRRHLSLPTPDGRVPIVGLDQQLSREALLSYQQLRHGRYQFLAAPPPRRLGGELEAEGEDVDRNVASPHS